MGRRKKGRVVNGWLALDKPAGVTSTQVLNRVRRLFDAAKAGHAGTLDPIATGVLPIAFGEATKMVSYAMDNLKAYRFTITWGRSTTTDDREGETLSTSTHRPAPGDIEAALPAFTGEIIQTPPAFSAIKVDGARAYDLARQGEVIALKARPIWIESITVAKIIDPDSVELDVVCGKGAYMRALARDLAVALGTVGHLTSIRRTAVGAFTLDLAVTVDQLEASAGEGTLDTHLLPIHTPLDDIPAVAVSEQEAQRLRNGQSVPLLRRSDIARLQGLDHAGDGLILAMRDDIPIALTSYGGAQLQPVRVLNLH